MKTFFSRKNVFDFVECDNRLGVWDLPFEELTTLSSVCVDLSHGSNYQLAAINFR